MFLLRVAKAPSKLHVGSSVCDKVHPLCVCSTLVPCCCERLSLTLLTSPFIGLRNWSWLRPLLVLLLLRLYGALLLPLSLCWIKSPAEHAGVAPELVHDYLQLLQPFFCCLRVSCIDVAIHSQGLLAGTLCAFLCQMVVRNPVQSCKKHMTVKHTMSAVPACL